MEASNERVAEKRREISWLTLASSYFLCLVNFSIEYYIYGFQLGLPLFYTPVLVPDPAARS